MSHITLILVILIATIGSFGMVCSAADEKTNYGGYDFDPEFVPSGMISYDGGWSHGSLFSAPYWLLKQIDQSLMSKVLDRGASPGFIPIPDNPNKYYVFDMSDELKSFSPFTSIIST